MISQEERRKQFFMGGRAIVSEVLMRHSGHGLLGTWHQNGSGGCGVT